VSFVIEVKLSVCGVLIYQAMLRPLSQLDDRVIISGVSRGLSQGRKT